MTIQDTKYDLWKVYYMLHENKIAEFKAHTVYIIEEVPSHGPASRKVYYNGYINGNCYDNIGEDRIFHTKEDIIKYLYK